MADPKLDTLSPALAFKRSVGGGMLTPELLQRMRELGLLAPGNNAELEAKVREAGLLAPSAPLDPNAKSYRYQVVLPTWREEASRFCEKGETYVSARPHYSTALQPMDEETRVATEAEKTRIDEHRLKFEKKNKGQSIDIEALVKAAMAAGRQQEIENAARALAPAVEDDKPAADDADPKSDKGKGGKKPGDTKA